MNLYLNGTEKTDLVYHSRWTLTDTISFPDDTQLLAVKCTDRGGKYGLYTHLLEGEELFPYPWRCVSDYIPGWETPGFDDTDWPKAADVEPYELFKTMMAESRDSKLFWTADGDTTVYCRLKGKKQ